MSGDADTLFTAIPFARDLREEAQALLAERVRALPAEPGSVLLTPGDEVSGIYFVAAGAVRVHYLDANGQEGTLYRLGPGESCVLALNCLFAEMRYPAWAEAEEGGASLLVLDGAAARDLIRVDDGFTRAMFEQVSTRIYSLLGTLERAIRLPQERLASHLGTSREVVSRLLRGFVRDGLVESGYGRIRIVDQAGLRQRGM